MAQQHVTAIFSSDRLSSMRKLVLLALARRADDEGQCTASIADIAHDTGLARRTVQMHLSALIRANVVQRFWGPGRQPVVRLNLGALQALSVPARADARHALTKASQQ